MAAKGRRRFGRVRQLPSGRWQARVPDPSRPGRLIAAPTTFATEVDADRWLNAQETHQAEGRWVDPSAGCVTLTAYADDWLEQRPDLRLRTRETYRGLLDLHILPTLGATDLARLTPAAVRRWHRAPRRSRRPRRLDRGQGVPAAADDHKDRGRRRADRQEPVRGQRRRRRARARAPDRQHGRGRSDGRGHARAMAADRAAGRILHGPGGRAAGAAPARPRSAARRGPRRAQPTAPRQGRPRVWAAEDRGRPAHAGDPAAPGRGPGHSPRRLRGAKPTRSCSPAPRAGSCALPRCTRHGRLGSAPRSAGPSCTCTTYGTPGSPGGPPLGPLRPS